MQHDEVIWQVLNQGFCSFKVKTTTATFCKHPQNVTGLCNRSSCPLANSRYATVMEHDGRCYLYSKSIERAHLPSAMWEKRRLPSKYSDALAVIDRELLYWPNFLVHKCKQRLTKIHQYLIRMRRIRLTERSRLVTVNRKVERREKVREAKAEKAARLSNAISAELIARLQAGTYEGSGMYVPNAVFQRALEKVGQKDDDGAILGDDEHDDEDEQQQEAEEGDEDEDEDELQLEDEVEFVEDFEPDEDEDDVEDTEQRLVMLAAADAEEKQPEGPGAAAHEDPAEDVTAAAVGSGKSTRPAVGGRHAGRKRGAVEIEYEEERQGVRIRH